MHMHGCDLRQCTELFGVALYLVIGDKLRHVSFLNGIEWKRFCFMMDGWNPAHGYGGVPHPLMHI